MAFLGDGLLVIAALGTGFIAYRAWRNRPRAGMTPLAGMMLGIFLWLVAHLVEHHTTGAANLGARKLKWTGIVPVAFFWFAFVLDYVGREEFLARRYLVVLFCWPVLLALSLWLPEGGPFAFSAWQQVGNEQGLVFWGHVGLSYGLLAVGSGLLLHHVASLPALFRRQGLAVLAGLGAGWGGSVVSLFGLFGDVHIHALAIGFTLMGGFMLWAIVGKGLTEITPIARRTVIETLSAGVVVIDADHQVTSANPAARRLLGLDDGTDLVGRAVAEVFAEHPALRDWIDALEPETDERTETIHVGDRVVECEPSPLSDDRDRFVGTSLLLYDVTEQRRQQTELERQNERLEEFASIVAHDLRNPLSVARGWVDLAREDCESPHLEAAEQAHARMEDLIDDLLALARQGEQSIDPTAIEMPTFVEQCWQSVDTENAGLGQVAEFSVEADPRRLRQLLENLFRNAVEHGGTDVTVTVGELPDGFYVADDGKGIAVDDRPHVFEAGYSTTDSGSGLGLNIVEEIVTLHDWNVHVTTSESGGARFEFTNVARATRS